MTYVNAQGGIQRSQDGLLLRYLTKTESEMSVYSAALG